jgi:hypothetical protein
MNSLFAGLMKEAAQLTRTGRLAEATDAIQRALRGGAEAEPGHAPAAAPAPNTDVTDAIDVTRPMRPT